MSNFINLGTAGAMPNRPAVLVDPLLQPTPPQNDGCVRTRLASVCVAASTFLVVGLFSWILQASRDRGQHAVLEATVPRIASATRAVPAAGALIGVWPWPSRGWRPVPGQTGTAVDARDIVARGRRKVKKETDGDEDELDVFGEPKVRTYAKPTPPPEMEQRMPRFWRYDAGELSDSVTTEAGVKMPRMLYTIAAKGARTEDNVLRAIRVGIRGFDSGAPQTRYNESGLRAALEKTFAAGVARDELFIQSKVNMKYAQLRWPDEPVEKQVELAAKESLSNLGLEYVDSLLLQFPELLGNHTMIMPAWAAMEALYHAGLARQLGMSDVSHYMPLVRIHRDMEVKPAVVQHEVIPESAFERDIRDWSDSEGYKIYFQSRRTLSTQLDNLLHPGFRQLAEIVDCSIAQLLYRFMMGLGIIPIMSSDRDQDMSELLGSMLVPLSLEDAEDIDTLVHPRYTLRSTADGYGVEDPVKPKLAMGLGKYRQRSSTWDKALQGRFTPPDTPEEVLDLQPSPEDIVAGDDLD